MQSTDTDPLTGLPSMCIFLRVGERLTNEATLAGTPLAAICTDIDGLKPINDRWGHKVGDAVLREVGKLVSRTISAPGSVHARAGDEFATLLPGTDVSSAFATGQALCRAIEEAFRDSDLAPGLTVSVGVASSPQERDWTLNMLLEMAGGRVQGAKNNGKNCAVGSDNPGIWLHPELRDWPAAK